MHGKKRMETKVLSRMKERKSYCVLDKVKPLLINIFAIQYFEYELGNL
jgi:hypothetical protein